MRNCRAEHRRRVSRRRGRYPVRRALPVGRARLRSLRRCFFSCASTDLRRAGSCGREAARSALSCFSSSSFSRLPRRPVPGRGVPSQWLRCPSCISLSGGDAVEGVDEVLAGGFRIDRQAAVVIVVEEVAFTSHEETVLAEVRPSLTVVSVLTTMSKP